MFQKIGNVANFAYKSLLPKKSKEEAYKNFGECYKGKDTGVYETTLLGYFMEKLAKLKPSASLLCDQNNYFVIAEHGYLETSPTKSISMTQE